MKPKKIILIGASTGGPGLIEKIVTSLETLLDTIIIVAQHMEPYHLASFSKRLGRIGSISVVLVKKKEALEAGKIYVLEDTLELSLENESLFLQKNALCGSYYHPQIDELFFSACRVHKCKIVAYILSGIGADGAKGMLALKSARKKTVAQDKATSIVYGMPKRANELGACEAVMSIEKIIEDIKKEIV